MIADIHKKSLIIVESPTKAKTIGKYLKDYPFTVVASKGHIVDLNPNPGNRDGVYGVYVDDGFKLDYVVVEGKDELISEMKKLLKGKEQLILASDEDREGESIAYHLKTRLNPTVPVYRMVFHEITKKAIQEAFSSCRDIDMNLVHAQEARRAVDRLQGYGISPLLSKKLGSKYYSAGRVQSPALKLIVEKERVRRGYEESAYLSLEAVAKDKNSAEFPIHLIKIGDKTIASSSSFDRETGSLSPDAFVLDRETADRVANELSLAGSFNADIDNSRLVVESVANRIRNERPSIPFTTSTLQMEANVKLGMGSKETMSVAQRLYENGFITYMRTDSPNLSEECIRAARAQVVELFGESYLNSTERNYKAKNPGAQEAHEAIRPAGEVFRVPEESGLEGSELKLYTLIWKRTLATQMKECNKSITTVTMSYKDYTFLTTGTTILFPGFRRCYEPSFSNEESDSPDILPSLEAGEVLAIESIDIKEHITTPPARYNEATLVQKLEKEEIGRPSTYATIITTLLDKGYVVKDGRQLVPTFTGFFVDSFLEKSFAKYIDYDFTKRMENELDEIAEGTVDKAEYLKSFWFGDGQGFNGLDRDILEVRASKNSTELRELYLDKLAYSFSHEGFEVHYSIKIGQYGPYIASDYKEDDSDRTKMASIDEKLYFPGSFTDRDAEKLLFGTDEAEELLYGKYAVKNGKFGLYLESADSEKKRVTWTNKRKRPEEADEDYLDLLFSLPTSLGFDKEGNEVVLKAGPYGVYASYKGKNISVKNPMTVTLDTIINDSDCGEYQGKSVNIASSRYGAYLKWGDVNIALSKEEKSNIYSMSDAEIAAIIDAYILREQNSKRDERTFTLSDGTTVTLLVGKFGPYLKRGKDNIALPEKDKADLSQLTEERVNEIVSGYKGKRVARRRATKKE